MRRPTAFLALAALACDPPFVPPVFIASLRVTPDSAILETGGNLQLSVVATDSAGHNLGRVPVTWTSSVDTIATVSKTGLIHCLRPGFANISAAAAGVTGTAFLSIMVRVTAVHIDQPPVALVPGGSLPFTAYTLDTMGEQLAGRLVAWSSTDTTVFSVSPVGLVSARRSGRAFIRASAGPLWDSVPITVGLVRYVQLSTGMDNHTCGLTADSITYCWGQNDLDQLGLTSGGVPVSAPVSPSTTPRFTTLAVGGTFACGDQAAGTVYCWGSSAGGRLGGGVTALTHAAPAPVLGGAALFRPSANWAHACALAGGVAVCWGRNPAAGGTADVNWTPTVVTSNEVFTSIATGEDFTCAVNTDSAAFCWGQNDEGQLGTGSTGLGTPVPTAVAGGLAFVQVASGQDHACGLTSSGAAYCWGLNAVGDSAPGDPPMVQPPVPVTGGLSFTALSGGGGQTCGIAKGGGVYCWTSALSLAPSLQSSSLTFSSITVGGEAVCGIGTDGVAYCWGPNFAGENGDGTLNWGFRPTRVLGQP